MNGEKKKNMRPYRPLIPWTHWHCKKCENFFREETIPRDCPCCGSRKIHGVSRDIWELFTNTKDGFADYQLRTGDNYPGAYGRFIARKCGLP